MSSIRSRQTGQVGNSIKFGVGGGNGLSELDVAELDGVKGSWLRSGKLPLAPLGVSKVTDLMKATVHASGYIIVSCHGCSRLDR